MTMTKPIDSADSNPTVTLKNQASQPKQPLYGLAKQERILKPGHFKSIYKNKQFGVSRYFSFNAMGDQPSTRLGITVAKKVSKRAVDRNHIKRVVREFFRHQKHTLSHSHIVITARAGAATANNQALRESLQELQIKMVKWKRWHERTHPPA